MLIPLSTVILLVILYGLIQRRNRKVHIPVMMLAFVMDIALVLYIELNRHAIAQTISEFHGLLMFHVSVSLMVVILYIVMTVLGFKILKGGNPGALLWHRRLAYLFIIGRLTNYITSFWM